MADRRKKQANKKELRSERITRRVALVLVLLAVVGLAYWQTQQWVNDPDTLPIKIVRIDGEMKYLQKSQLENAVAAQVSGGFFKIDLQQIKQTAKKLAWVEEVSVKRVWPDTLLMSIQEKQAMARWGNKRLVTARGAIFLPPDVMPEGLPLLNGPDERVNELVSRFQKEQQRFAREQLAVAELSVNDRGAWSLQFVNGLKIAVGRNDVETRLERLARYLDTIKQVKGMPESIDLRYRHGMAVMWKQIDKQNNEVKKAEGAV